MNFFPFGLNIKRIGTTLSYDQEASKLYIFGGFVNTEGVDEFGCSTEIEVIDFVNHSVTHLNSSLLSPSPAPRCESASIIFNHKFYVYGGCDRLPLLNGKWIFCDFSNSLWVFSET